jgi:hypothetical protein
MKPLPAPPGKIMETLADRSSPRPTGRCVGSGRLRSASRWRSRWRAGEVIESSLRGRGQDVAAAHLPERFPKSTRELKAGVWVERARSSTVLRMGIAWSHRELVADPKEARWRAPQDFASI